MIRTEAVRNSLVIALILSGAVSYGVSQAQQTPAPGTPLYRSGTAVLRVDASVLDANGRTVRDLQPSDFQVEIDGRPRKVLFADLPEPVLAEPTTAAPSYVANSRRGQGRAIVLLVDLESIRAGAERTILETAAGLVDKLGPSDAVALIPVPGPSIPLTREHARVRDAIKELRGTSNVPNFRHFFTLEEALAYERGDKRTIDEVVERECAKDVETARADRGLNAVCPGDLVGETRERVSFERQHVEVVLAKVLDVVHSLAAVDAPSSLVLISGGLGFDPASLGRFQQVTGELKQAGISTYAVQVNQPEVDAAASRAAKASTYSSNDREAGLANVATMADGVFFSGIGRATGVFERLRAEIAEPYALGVEAAPGDLDGKAHEVRVQVARSGVVTRAQRHVLAASASPDLDAALARLIATPVDRVDFPVSVAAFTVRGEEATTVKVLVRADLGRGGPGKGPLRYAAMILSSNGQPVLQTGGTAAPPDGVASVLVTGQLVPGAYRVRVAAIDTAGRAGSVEMPFRAGVRSIGGLQLSDVLPGARDESPAIYVPAGTSFDPRLELSSAEVERFAHTSVRFEVQRVGDSAAVQAVNAPLTETAFERQQIASTSMSTDGLAPGGYTVSAVIGIDGVATGRVSRSFVLVPAAVVANRTPVVTAASPDAPQPPERTAAASEPATVPDAALREVLNRVAAYVSAYGQNTAAVVALEKYTQFLDESGRPQRLTADFALVKTGAGRWLGYRDVIEVNGEPVPDRRNRLLALLKTSSNPLDDAARLTAESARFNVGPVMRNFNVPTTALLFFDAAGLSRFTFTRRGSKKIRRR